jgi:hypothetical protein
MEKAFKVFLFTVIVLAVYSTYIVVIMETVNFITRRTGGPIIGFWVAGALGFLSSLLFGGSRANK